MLEIYREGRALPGQPDSTQSNQGNKKLVQSTPWVVPSAFPAPVSFAGTSLYAVAGIRGILEIGTKVLERSVPWTLCYIESTRINKQDRISILHTFLYGNPQSRRYYEHQLWKCL